MAADPNLANDLTIMGKAGRVNIIGSKDSSLPSPLPCPLLTSTLSSPSDT